MRQPSRSQSRRLLAGASAVWYSDEYVYKAAALAACTDRSFRKACRRMEGLLVKEGLRLCVHSGDTVTKQLVGRCMRCRNVWERLRAAGREEATAAHLKLASDGGGGGEATTERAHPPPKRNYYLSTLMSKRLLADGSVNPDVAIFVIWRTPLDQSPNVEDLEPTPILPEEELVAGYLLTEGAGRTIVSVDGVHDYSVSDSRADPSAWLLHVAAKWWSESGAGGGLGGAAVPLWLNDGPVPTPGLLAYKLQYHGQLQHLLSLRRAG